MNKTTCFAKRNLLEMTRDPLSYIFCVAFPLVMLVIMTLVNESIPNKEQSIFNIDNLAGGVIVFGQTFIMLFTALGISMDRSGSFLTRLFASPMKSRNFILGYVLPMLVIAEIQIILTMIASLIISMITGHSLSILSLPLAMITCLPSALMFISIFGFCLGTSSRSAPQGRRCSLRHQQMHALPVLHKGCTLHHEAGIPRGALPLLTAHRHRFHCTSDATCHQPFQEEDAG